MPKKKKRNHERNGKPIGRPSEYDPAYCELLIQDMANGFSFEAFAGKVGVSRQTLYEWVSVHPAFSDAKRRAVELCRRKWEELGMDGLPAGTMNAAVWIYNMKCRFPQDWRDVQKVEVNDVTDEEKKQKLAETIQKNAETKAKWKSNGS